MNAPDGRHGLADDGRPRESPSLRIVPRQYPRMQDSGVPWLGDVPEHWEVRQLGHLGELLKGRGGSKEDETGSGVPCVRYGDLYTRHEHFIRAARSHVSPDRARSYMPIRYGDVLFAASGETIEDIGKSAVNLIEKTACCGGDVILLRPRHSVEPKFLGYAAESPASRTQKALMGRGFTIAHIYGSDLKRLALAIPPLAEQAAIVRFLDHVDRRIRRYIRTKQKLIVLLEEQKRATIHRAVTRGLHSGVRLEPSRVDWLGDTPAHWKLRRVKEVSRILRGKFTHRPRNDPSLYDGPFPFIQTGDVARAGKSITHYKQTLNEKGRAVSKFFPAGTLVMTIAANIGDVAVLDFAACFPDSVVGFLPQVSLERDFLYYVMRAMRPELLKEAPVNTQGNLNVERLGSRRIAVPPPREQRAIVEHIEGTTLSLDLAVQAHRQQISLFREYRTRCFADVVTGKLDVREAAAHLPDETADPEAFDEPEARTNSDDAPLDDLGAPPGEANE